MSQLAPCSRASAGPTLLYDATVGNVLYAEDADHPWYPASLTKLMTAYLVFEAWKSGRAERTGKITISARANSRPRMRLGLGVGKVITFDEAMVALIIHSANDIAVALAEAVAGSEAAFVEQMNSTAIRLGMRSTRFINAHGLPGEGQHSTARDLAMLTRALMMEFPEHAGFFSQLNGSVAGRAVATHNPVLIRTLGGDGMKTGFTCSAGYNIVASATRDGTRLVAIVLGEQTQAKRQERTAALIEHGFRMLEWKAIFPPATLETLPVEPFDIEKVSAANLAKRYKDCRAPEQEYDADGNPICPPVKVVKAARSARALKIAKAMKTARTKPDVCAPPVVAKLKQPSDQSAKVAPKRAAARTVARKAGPTDREGAATVFGGSLP